MALRDVRIFVRQIVVEVARKPGVDGTRGDELDVESDGAGDADFEAACCAHGISGVEDVSGGDRGLVESCKLN